MSRDYAEHSKSERKFDQPIALGELHGCPPRTLQSIRLSCPLPPEHEDELTKGVAANGVIKTGKGRTFNCSVRGPGISNSGPRDGEGSLVLIARVQLETWGKRGIRTGANCDAFGKINVYDIAGYNEHSTVYVDSGA